jgi:hypothetical protein
MSSTNAPTGLTLTITLPPETGEKLLARAAASGKDVKAWVQEAIEHQLAVPAFEEVCRPVHEAFRQSGMTETELDALLEEARDGADGF